MSAAEWLGKDYSRNTRILEMRERIADGQDLVRRMIMAMPAADFKYRDFTGRFGAPGRVVVHEFLTVVAFSLFSGDGGARGLRTIAETHMDVNLFRALKQFASCVKDNGDFCENGDNYPVFEGSYADFAAGFGDGSGSVGTARQKVGMLERIGTMDIGNDPLEKKKNAINQLRLLAELAEKGTANGQNLDDVAEPMGYTPEFFKKFTNIANRLFGLFQQGDRRITAL
jgi:hypothetical protein